MDKLKIVNARVVTPCRVINNGCIISDNGKLAYVGPENNVTEDMHVIDAKGLFAAPGFVDIHTHGGGGHDFMDGTVEAFLGAVEAHARHGTTSIVPTTLTSTNEELKKTFEIYKEAKELNNKGAEFLGLHLEGPYFSMEQKGAQDPRFIRDPRPEEYMEILSWSDDIIRWSAAPELDGAMDFARNIKERGILPSIAHSDAIYEQVLEAFESGFTHVTHLYSATSMVRRINAYRYAGIIESAYLLDDMTVEIIADGAHLPASLLKLIYKIKGASKIALVTDSMRAAGLPDGQSTLGSMKNGMPVIVEDGVAKLPDRSAFAGSVATADRLVRNMIKLADVPLLEAVKMMTGTPAGIIGVSDRKGSLVKGKDADIVLFNDDIEIKWTILKGKILYEKS